MASDAQQHRSDRILKSPASEGLHGCPICFQGRFSVGPEHDEPISILGPSAAEGAPVEGSAVVPVMRGMCGYTMLFSPGKLPEQGE
jgi:hypothetical protein